MNTKSAAELKTEVDAAQYVVDGVTIANELILGSAATELEVALVIEFGKQLADYHGHGTDSWKDEPIESVDALAEMVKNGHEKPLNNAIDAASPRSGFAMTCIANLTMSCFDASMIKVVKKAGKVSRRIRKRVVGYEAYRIALQTEKARDTFSLFRSGEISTTDRPLIWPKRLYSNSIIGTRGFRLAVAYDELSNWIKEEGSSSPLVNFYLEIAEIASTLVISSEGGNNRFDQLSGQLTQNKRWLWSCSDSSIVGLSTNNRLCVVGETSAELAETNTSILQPLKANSKDASSRPRTQVERGLSNIEDEELPELLEVADLILQWLENQRKPKMTSKDKMISKDFARWLDEKGYAGNREEFLRVYESERQHKCQLRIAKTGSGRTKVPEAIKRQKKWIAALKAEQNARL